MERLIVDISPMAVNRTAMYFVVQDTVRALIDRGYDVELSGSGLPINLAEFIANDFQLTGTQSREVFRRVMEIVSAPTEPRGFRQLNGLFVVFDPLYLLSKPTGTRALAVVLDLTPLTRPSWHNEAVSKAYAVAFGRLHNRAVAIASISESTARDIWANLGIPQSQVTLVPLYNRLRIDRPRGQGEQVLLFVGSLELRKNVIGLGLAFAASGLVLSGYQLHIIGGDGHGSDEIKNALAGIPGIALIGRAGDEVLAEAYDSCAALVYPSYWEGFGLPALEALARGIPVLLSDTGALPEVAGDHAVYVDPCNVDSIRRGLLQIAEVAAHDSESAIDGRRRWAGEFTFDRYITQLHVALASAASTVTNDDAMPRRSPLRRVATNAGPPNSKRARLLRRRILDATLDPVPGDSFSLDYLYGVQSEARAQFVRAVSHLRRVSPLEIPMALTGVLSSAARLQARNLVVRSMINETVTRRLHEHSLDP